jgi:hypothetical protein
MDLKETIQKEFDRMSDEGEIEKAIRDKVKETITSSINDAFRPYGKIGKSIEKSIEDNFKLDFSRVSLDEYNLIITQMVKRLALEHVEENAKKHIQERLTDLLGPPPEKITIQELVDTYTKSWLEEGCVCTESAHIEIKHHDWGLKSTTIKLWKEKPSKYSSVEPELNIFISENKILLPRMNSKTWPSNTSFNLESRIYQMFVRGTVFIDAHDVSSCDISTSYYNY